MFSFAFSVILFDNLFAIIYTRTQIPDSIITPWVGAAI